MVMAKYAWKQIEKDYVEGVADKKGQQVYPTQRELSDKYGPDPSLIGRKAKKDQWLTKREIFCSKITEMRQQKSAEAISDEGSNFSLKCFNTANLMADKINALAVMSESAKDMSILSAALKNVQSVVQSTLGDDKESSNQELTIKVGIDNAET